MFSVKHSHNCLLKLFYIFKFFTYKMSNGSKLLVFPFKCKFCYFAAQENSTLHSHMCLDHNSIQPVCLTWKTDEVKNTEQNQECCSNISDEIDNYSNSDDNDEFASDNYCSPPVITSYPAEAVIGPSEKAKFSNDTLENTIYNNGHPVEEVVQNSPLMNAIINRAPPANAIVSNSPFLNVIVNNSPLADVINTSYGVPDSTCMTSKVNLPSSQETFSTEIINKVTENMGMNSNEEAKKHACSNNTSKTEPVKITLKTFYKYFEKIRNGEIKSPSIFICCYSDCDFQTLTKVSYKNHLKICHEDGLNIFRCLFCEFHFERRKNCLIHMLCDHCKTIYICETCNNFYTIKLSIWNEHLKKH